MDRPAKIWVPHEYQQTAEKFIYRNTIAAQQRPCGAALLLDPGLGKTSICLQAISSLRQMQYIRRALVIAPKRVAIKVWPGELQEWENFRHLSMGVAVGSAEHRKKILANSAYDIHVINRDVIDWLNSRLKAIKSPHLPWQMVIIDESTSFKQWSAARSKALRQLILRIPYRVILTGTPAPRDLSDLFPQMWLLDEGASLGQNITQFRQEYCTQVGHRKFTKYELRNDVKEKIHNKISHLCLRLDAKDYLSMPEKLTHDVMVDLPPSAMQQYRDMERQLLLAVEEGSRDVANAAALYTACRQVANGAIYGNERQVLQVHNEKIEAVKEIVSELNGKPALIPYTFEHDAARLEKAIPGITVVRGGMKDKDFLRVVDLWNEDRLDPPFLAVQPKALSFGVNMQHGSGRDIIWFGLTDSLDDYIQLNARIWRQGVTSQVRIHRVLASGTVDEMVRDRTDQKYDVQSNLLQHLREYAKRVVPSLG